MALQVNYSSLMAAIGAANRRSRMYSVIVVSASERVVYCGRDGYTALDISVQHRNKTKFAIVLQTPKGKRYSMAQQDVMIRRLKIAASAA